MADIPNCPLCGSEMTEARNARPGWLYCAAYVSDLTCVMPVVREDQARALAALRKPRRDQRKRDVRPWRIEVFEVRGEWVARVRWMIADGVTAPPYSLHVCGVGWGATRAAALRACIAEHRATGTGWRRTKRKTRTP